MSIKNRIFLKQNDTYQSRSLFTIFLKITYDSELRYILHCVLLKYLLKVWIS